VNTVKRSTTLALLLLRGPDSLPYVVCAVDPLQRNTDAQGFRTRAIPAPRQ
jgi:hypothetical protein